MLKSLRLIRWPWLLGAVAVALVVALPLLFVLGYAFVPSDGVWQHLKETVLGDYILNSLTLIMLTVVLSAIWGVGWAWITVRYRFPFSRLFSWLLALPLAIPTYIIAYAYEGVFSFVGPVYQTMKTLGYEGSRIDIMNLPSLCLLLSFVLYPYIYLACRVAFLGGHKSTLEAAQSLGAGEWKLFRKIMLPLARTGLAAGGFLVAMEILNDYGAMKYFGINTFTTGIFSAWLDMGDLAAALKLASLLLAVVLLLLVAERRYRKGKRSSTAASESIAIEPSQRKQWTFTSLGLLFLSVVLFVPICFLFNEALHEEFSLWFADWKLWTFNSLLLGLGSAILIVSFALVVVFNEKIQSTIRLPWLSTVAGIGYVIPGAVIALGVMFWGNRWLNGVDRSIDTVDLIWGIALLIIAYFIRFLAIGLSTTTTASQTVGSSLPEAATALGASAGKTFRKVFLPLVSNGVWSAVLLVFVDVIKELPLTLILRPFNFYTLATKTFEYADDEMLSRAAFPALLIIALGIIPMYLAYRITDRI